MGAMGGATGPLYLVFYLCLFMPTKPQLFQIFSSRRMMHGNVYCYCFSKSYLPIRTSD